MSDSKPKLHPQKLYFGDNGRVFCGSLRCAGTSSYYTGRDISGQRVQAARTDDAVEFTAAGLTLACENCGAELRAPCS